MIWQASLQIELVSERQVSMLALRVSHMHDTVTALAPEVAVRSGWTAPVVQHMRQQVVGKAGDAFFEFANSSVCVSQKVF